MRRLHQLACKLRLHFAHADGVVGRNAAVGNDIFRFDGNVKAGTDLTRNLHVCRGCLAHVIYGGCRHAGVRSRSGGCR